MAGAMQTLHQQQQTPQRPPRRLRQRQATLVLGVVLAAVVGCATAFVPSSPAPRVQGWQAPPLQPLSRLPEGQRGGAGRRRRAGSELSRLAVVGKGFGKNLNKGGPEDGDKKKQRPQPSASSGGAKSGAGGQAASGGVARPPVGGTVQTPQGEVPRKFQMLYTCNICDGRNLITVDRVAFTEGIVVAKCKHCDAKHLVADNLSKLDFGKGKVTLDDILALRGEKAERVDLASNPDLAKYDLAYKDDGTVELMPKGKEDGGAASQA